MSVRERLRNRQLPVTTVAIRVEYTAESDAAEKELVDATRALRLAEFREQDSTQARARVDAARTAFDTHHEVIRLRALPPAEMEALIAAHPPTAEQRKNDSSAVWNETTFRAALIAACAHGEETEGDWAELLSSGPITSGEVRALFAAAIALNDRSVDLRVGKGSAGS